MDVVLIIATLVGGLAGAWFLWDKYLSKNDIPTEDKVVENEWWEHSSTKEGLAQKGYEFRWSNIEKLATREQDGYQVIHEIQGNKRFRLLNKSGQILMGKKSNANT
jgi:hypothetical protein